MVNYYSKCVQKYVSKIEISLKNPQKCIWLIFSCWYRLRIVFRSLSQIFSFQQGLYSKLQAIKVSVFDFHQKHVIFYSKMVYFKGKSKTETLIACNLEKRPCRKLKICNNVRNTTLRRYQHGKISQIYFCKFFNDISIFDTYFCTHLL